MQGSERGAWYALKSVMFSGLCSKIMAGCSMENRWPEEGVCLCCVPQWWAASFCSNFPHCSAHPSNMQITLGPAVLTTWISFPSNIRQAQHHQTLIATTSSWGLFLTLNPISSFPWAKFISCPAHALFITPHLQLSPTCISPTLSRCSSGSIFRPQGHKSAQSYFHLVSNISVVYPELNCNFPNPSI